MWGFFFKRRPDINEQNTGHYAYQRSNDYTLAPYNGGAGFTVQRTIAAYQPATIAPGPSEKLNDPTVTGNTSGSPLLLPLSKNNLNADMDTGMIGAQF